MGYDSLRFKEEVDEELICPICTGVLEDPVQVTISCDFILFLTSTICWFFHDSSISLFFTISNITSFNTI